MKTKQTKTQNLKYKDMQFSDFRFPGQKGLYKGKVRDVYNIKDEIILMIATDRISAFDVVLPQSIPYKGQVLNQMAAYFLDATAHIVPNWKMATPDPMVTAGLKCEPFKVEMVIRGYLTGHAWRLYKAGVREICGLPMPEGMKENQAFATPLITPTTKADRGHDEDISKEAILQTAIVSPEDYQQLETYTRKLFAHGQKMASERGLLLVDTKYEFGKKDGKIYLIDEIHTPDSSRYFYAHDYEAKLQKGEAPKQLSKEFVRKWLMEQGFDGKSDTPAPLMSESFTEEVSQRYIELYETITAQKFQKADTSNVPDRIEKNCIHYLESLRA